MPEFNKFESPKQNGQILEIEEFVETCLDGSDYYNGALEDVRDQAQNVTKAFARLIGVLYKTKKITRKEAVFIARG
jgi:hypothetical protein